MGDRPLYRLTDIMRGIRKHGLIDRMSQECFTFLVGLILEANELGFKNPIGLTVNQALPIGGGNNRQTLHSRRTSLAKFKIDGKQLVKIKAGNKGKNSVATYEIDYNLLCSYNSVWQQVEELPSKKLDNSPDSTPTVDPTVPLRLTPQSSDHPKIREEERRTDPPTPQNDITTQVSSETEEAGAGRDGLVEDSEEDWITYVIDIMKKPNEQFPEIGLTDTAAWLVKHNDLALIEECYDAFQQIPIADVRNRPAYFMRMIEQRGGKVIR